MPATQRGTSGPRAEHSGSISLPAGSVLGEMWSLKPPVLLSSERSAGFDAAGGLSPC